MSFNSTTSSSRRPCARPRHYLASVLLLLVAVPTTWASEVTIPHVFVANTPAVADQVNQNFGAQNFGAVETAVDNANVACGGNLQWDSGNWGEDWN